MISIIIPVYNRAITLKRCIDSVLNQSYKDFELIIVDDCSTDDSVDIIKSYNDNRIKLIEHEKNMGANAARNTGIKQARGKYIAFQDSDDQWHRNKLQTQLVQLQEKSVDIVSCSFIYINGKEKKVMPQAKIKDSEISNLVLRYSFMSTQTLLGRKECFLDIMFDERVPRFQDWELVIRLAQKYSFSFINKPLLKAYVQEDSITKNLPAARTALLMILDKNKELYINNPKALKKMYRTLSIYSTKVNNFNVNYCYVGIKEAGFDFITFYRLIQFLVLKLKMIFRKKIVLYLISFNKKNA